MNNNDPYSNGDYSANPYLSYQKFNKRLIFNIFYTKSQYYRKR